MDQPREAGRMAWHPERTTLDFDALPAFLLITPGRVARLYLPVRIVWQRSDHMHLVLLGSQIGGKLTGVFSDAGGFRVEVEAYDQNFCQGKPPLFLRKQKIALDGPAVLVRQIIDSTQYKFPLCEP